jgi:hypothetical protein
MPGILLRSVGFFFPCRSDYGLGVILPWSSVRTTISSKSDTATTRNRIVRSNAHHRRGFGSDCRGGRHRYYSVLPVDELWLRICISTIRTSSLHSCSTSKECWHREHRCNMVTTHTETDRYLELRLLGLSSIVISQIQSGHMSCVPMRSAAVMYQPQPHSSPGPRLLVQPC